MRMTTSQCIFAKHVHIANLCAKRLLHVHKRSALACVQLCCHHVDYPQVNAVAGLTRCTCQKV